MRNLGGILIGSMLLDYKVTLIISLVGLILIMLSIRYTKILKIAGILLIVLNLCLSGIKGYALTQIRDKVDINKNGIEISLYGNDYKLKYKDIKKVKIYKDKVVVSTNITDMELQDISKIEKIAIESIARYKQIKVELK